MGALKQSGHKLGAAQVVTKLAHYIEKSEQNRLGPEDLIDMGHKFEEFAHHLFTHPEVVQHVFESLARGLGVMGLEQLEQKDIDA